MPNSPISSSGLNRNPRNIYIYSSGYDPAPSLTSNYFSIFEIPSNKFINLDKTFFLNGVVPVMVWMTWNVVYSQQRKIHHSKQQFVAVNMFSLKQKIEEGRWIYVREKRTWTDWAWAIFVMALAAGYVVLVVYERTLKWILITTQ
jgi:hypothetical protein